VISPQGKLTVERTCSAVLADADRESGVFDLLELGSGLGILTEDKSQLRLKDMLLYLPCNTESPDMHARNLTVVRSHLTLTRTDLYPCLPSTLDGEV
jgi:hypothetical protein